MPNRYGSLIGDPNDPQSLYGPTAFPVGGGAPKLPPEPPNPGGIFADPAYGGYWNGVTWVAGGNAVPGGPSRPLPAPGWGPGTPTMPPQTPLMPPEPTGGSGPIPTFPIQSPKGSPDAPMSLYGPTELPTGGSKPPPWAPWQLPPLSSPQQAGWDGSGWGGTGLDQPVNSSANRYQDYLSGKTRGLQDSLGRGRRSY